MSKYSGIALPAGRLLLACLLMIAAPAYLGMRHLPVAWLGLPCAVLTYISCRLQDYREARLVALCAASILGVLLVLYGLMYAGAAWL